MSRRYGWNGEETGEFKVGDRVRFTEAFLNVSSFDRSRFETKGRGTLIEYDDGLWRVGWENSRDSHVHPDNLEHVS